MHEVSARLDSCRHHLRTARSGTHPCGLRSFSAARCSGCLGHAQSCGRRRRRTPPPPPPSAQCRSQKPNVTAASSSRASLCSLQVLLVAPSLGGCASTDISALSGALSSQLCSCLQMEAHNENVQSCAEK